MKKSYLEVFTLKNTGSATLVGNEGGKSGYSRAEATETAYASEDDPFFKVPSAVMAGAAYIAPTFGDGE